VDTPRLLKNRYRLGTVIGRGGMGVVWHATDEVLDRPVAVKEVVFPPGLPDAERDTLRRRTLREARTNARLNHPNVVAVYDIVDEEDRPWIVMEYVPSRSLAEAVRADGPLSPPRAAEIGLQLLRGLRAAHAAGVLHRDVKPSNVLLADDGRVVLGDFGIATAKGGSTITSSGVLIGSPSYMAPERARGRDIGPESDLWSLGATLYTAVEGRPPFDRDGAVATLAALVMDDPDPPRNAGPLWPLISRLLSRDPAERPQADAVATSLREIAEPSGGRAPGAAAPSVPRPRTPPDDEPPVPEPPVPEPPLDDERPGPAAASPAEDSTEPRPPSGDPSAVSEPELSAAAERERGGEPEREPGGVAEPDRGAVAEPERGAVAGRDRGAAAEPEPGAVAGRATGPRRRSRVVVVAATATVVVIALLAWAVAGLPGAGHESRRRAPDAGGTPHRSTAPSPAATSSHATPPASPTTGALPGGYHWHHDGTGFSIAVPDGWSAKHHGHYLYVEDPKSPRILIVDQTDEPKSDPLADWRRQEDARRGGYPGYHRIRLEAVDYPQARKAADWEFTYHGSGGKDHVLNRNILVNGKHAYALYWSTPEDRWTSSRDIFDVFASSFRPATD
jgi:serine/threonine protein kinase